jgi:integrase/recombinase XerD
MTVLADALQDYLDVRRAVGFKLVAHGRLLADFVADLEAGGASTVTVEAALAWATKPADADRVWWAMRLGVAHGFARYLKVIDPANEVPSADLLPCRARRPEPHIYSDAEIQALMIAAGDLRPTVASGHVQDPHRFAGRDRHAPRGGVASRPR